MKPIALVIAAALCSAATAQTTAPSSPAARPSAKPAPAKSAPAKRAPAKPAPKPAVEVPPPAADEEQKTAASMAHLGDYACELDQTVSVAAHPTHEGYLDVKLKAQSWIMKPVLSTTGALRLEDVKGRMLMIQIANKSMMMDTKIGQRLVDDCIHETQREFTRTMATQPPQESLLK